MRVNERSLVVLIGGGLVVAAVVAVVLFLLLGGDDADPSAGDVAAGDNAAAALAGGPDEVLLLNGRSLVRHEVGEDDAERIRNLPPASVYAARGSSWIAYVNSKPVEDFTTEPELTLYDVEADEKVRLGAGVAPVWNPAGTRVAFLRPVEPRSCLGEECSGDVAVVTADPETGDEVDLLEPGRYSILGWAGDFLLVSDFADPTMIVSVSPQGEEERLDFPVSQFWDASPDGRWLVKTNAKKTEFVAFDDGRLGDERIGVGLGKYELLEGSWSHDSSRVAAVVGSAAAGKGDKGKGSGGAATTQVVTFSPDAPVAVEVPQTFGALGTVLWAPDNDAIVVAVTPDPKSLQIEALHCAIGNQAGCTSVTSWTVGVTLLRAE